MASDKRKPAQPDALKRASSGIAADADQFAELFEENTERARTLDSDWMYQLDDQVFGPIKPRELLEMLYAGELDENSPIALGDDDFQPLRRIGVFRVHLPKVAAHQAKMKAEAEAAKQEQKRKLFQRLRWLVFAIVILVLGAVGVVAGIRELRERRAEQEKLAKEAALKAELADLYARVTISPPLTAIVRDAPVPEGSSEAGPPHSSKGKPGKKAHASHRRSRKKAKAQTGEAAGGTLTRQEVMSGVASVFGGFKRCIVSQIQRDPESIPETLVLTFSINNDGVARQVSVRDRFLRNSPLVPCLSRTLAKAHWRKYKGEVQSVEYPITIGR